MDLTAWMEQWNMFPAPGGLILCAVSGGRDSVCLLHYLTALGRTRQFRVAAAHLNHKMRPTAERDVAFVRDLCRGLDVPFYLGEGDVYGKMAEWGLGAEETGRRLRYDFFERTAEAIGAEKIATAHHGQDQAETVLLNLLRGTGPEGLGGIPPVRGRYIRPLLSTPRREIEAYLAENGLSHVEDETNTDLAYARNRLRLSLWPELEGIHPGAAESICRTAAIVRTENEFMDTLAAERLPREGTALPAEALLSAPAALRPRMLRLLTERLGVSRKDFGAAHWYALEALCASGGMLDLPGGARAVCREGRLTLYKTSAAAEEDTLTEDWTVWGDYRLRLGGSGDAVLLRRCGPVTVGAPRPEARIKLPGSRGKRSVKRLLQERGIPPEKRDEVPALYAEGKTAFLWGVGTDEEFLPDETGEKIEITIEKIN